MAERDPSELRPRGQEPIGHSEDPDDDQEDPRPTLESELEQEALPRPRPLLTTYHGVLTPAAAWRDLVVPGSPVGL